MFCKLRVRQNLLGKLQPIFVLLLFVASLNNLKYTFILIQSKLKHKCTCIHAYQHTYTITHIHRYLHAHTYTYTCTHIHEKSYDHFEQFWSINKAKCILEHPLMLVFNVYSCSRKMAYLICKTNVCVKPEISFSWNKLIFNTQLTHRSLKF